MKSKTPVQQVEDLLGIEKPIRAIPEKVYKCQDCFKIFASYLDILDHQRHQGCSNFEKVSLEDEGDAA